MNRKHVSERSPVLVFLLLGLIAVGAGVCFYLLNPVGMVVQQVVIMPAEGEQLVLTPAGYGVFLFEDGEKVLVAFEIPEDEPNRVSHNPQFDTETFHYLLIVYANEEVVELSSEHGWRVSAENGGAVIFIRENAAD